MKFRGVFMSSRFTTEPYPSSILHNYTQDSPQKKKLHKKMMCHYFQEVGFAYHQKQHTSSILFLLSLVNSCFTIRLTQNICFNTYNYKL
jgi:hypothetical protein